MQLSITKENIKKAMEWKKRQKKPGFKDRSLRPGIVHRIPSLEGYTPLAIRERKELDMEMQLSLNQEDVATCREEAEKIGPDTIVSDGNYTIPPLSNDLELKEK